MTVIDEAVAFAARRVAAGRSPFENSARSSLEIAQATVPAYYNHSRWVADCPECNGGMRVERDQTLGACLDCGLALTIEFPATEDADAALRVLGFRERNNRNWHPGRESVADLKAENLRRGVAI